MKRSSLFFRSIIAFSFAVFALTSCDDTTTGGSGGTNANPPILEFVDNGAGSVTNDVQVQQGETLTFSITALNGDNPMNNVRFLEDGALVADYVDRITINGAPATSANRLLTEDEKTSFAWEITWAAHTEETSKTYAIQVVDTAGNTDEEAVIVNTVQAFPGPISLSIVDSGSGCFVTDATGVTPDSWFCVSLQGVRSSTSSLATIAVKENGSNMTDLTRLEYNGVAFDANPLTLPAADVDGFISSIRIKAPNSEGATSTFAFEIVDGESVSVSDELSVSTTITVIPSDITTNLGVLFNKSGPTGTGGLDLATGNSTGSTDPTADIADAGNISSGSQEWLKQISPANGSILTIAPASSEFPTTFDQIEYKSEIQDAYNLSNQVAITPAVVVGDVFLVADTSGNIFMIKCTNINETGSDNNDSYTFDIKY